MVVVVACVLCAVAVAGSASAAVPTLTGGSPHLAGWNGPISVSVASEPGDDPTDTYTVLWDGAAAPVEPTSGSGTCQTTADQPALSCRLVAAAKAGSHTLAVRDDLAGTLLKSSAITITPHLSSRLVKLAPLTFTPFKLDHVTDKLNMTFILNKVAGFSSRCAIRRGRSCGTRPASPTTSAATSCAGQAETIRASW